MIVGRIDAIRLPFDERLKAELVARHHAPSMARRAVDPRTCQCADRGPKEPRPRAMKPDTKNYYLALALSVLVVIGWNFFYAKPQPREGASSHGDRQTTEHADRGARCQAGIAGGACRPRPINAPPQGGVVPETPTDAA